MSAVVTLIAAALLAYLWQALPEQSAPRSQSAGQSLLEAEASAAVDEQRIRSDLREAGYAEMQEIHAALFELQRRSKSTPAEPISEKEVHDIDSKIAALPGYSGDDVDDITDPDYIQMFQPRDQELDILRNDLDLASEQQKAAEAAFAVAQVALDAAKAAAPADAAAVAKAEAQLKNFQAERVRAASDMDNAIGAINDAANPEGEFGIATTKAQLLKTWREIKPNLDVTPLTRMEAARSLMKGGRVSRRRRRQVSPNAAAVAVLVHGLRALLLLRSGYAEAATGRGAYPVAVLAHDLALGAVLLLLVRAAGLIDRRDTRLLVAMHAGTWCALALLPSLLPLLLPPSAPGEAATALARQATLALLSAPALAAVALSV